LDFIGSEIRSFFSIKEIYLVLDEEISSFKSVSEEYSQWLGTFLRDSKGAKENAEWIKNITALQKVKSRAKTAPAKEEKNKKGQKVEDDWIQYKEIKINLTEKGEAEILFEVTEELNTKLEKLERVKASLVELEKTGLGNDVVFIAYMHEGVPEKLVLRRKKETESTRKFNLNLDISLLRYLEANSGVEG
jgi:hypothetical protein